MLMFIFNWLYFIKDAGLKKKDVILSLKIRTDYKYNQKYPKLGAASSYSKCTFEIEKSYKINFCIEYNILKCRSRGGNSRRTSGISDGIYITAGRMIFKNCKNVRRRNFRQKQTEQKSKYS